MSPRRLLRIATRPSPLALWQAETVADLVRAAHPDVEALVVPTTTIGDRRTDVPITEIGGQGVFVKEVQALVLAGEADLAVHAAKDLPAVTAPGLSLAAIPARGDPRDVLVGTSWSDLAPGATIATGSVRRQAQLAWRRPDLTFVGLRGNIDTRLAKCPPGGALVMAAAALHRLGRASLIATTFTPEEMLPQVAQGAMAVECRSDDPILEQVIAAIDDRHARLTVEAERAWLARLGSGCDLPVGAHATIAEDGHALTLDAMIATVDGHIMLRDRMTGSVGERAALAAALADRLLDSGGGAAVLGLDGPPSLDDAGGSAPGSGGR